MYFDLSAPRGPGSADAYVLTSSGIPPAELVTAANAHINDAGYHGLGDDLQVKAMPALVVNIALSVTADVNLTTADKAQLQTDVENLLRAAFRESEAYPDVPRVAPYERVSRSALSGHIHRELAGVRAVDWTVPAADPQPGLALPVLGTLIVTVI
ncbi:MAG: baseplate J/gp47 family protein [Anaerolineae bacterium]|nr:baseplate J/gp47 family protein [Anaerolineae bacterium]